MAWLYRVPGVVVATLFSNLVATTFALRLATRKYGMRIDSRGSALALATAFASVVPILPVVYYSPFRSIVNVMIGIVIYTAAYLTLAPTFKAIKRTDLKTLAPILGRIRFLRHAVDLIFAYETYLLNRLEKSSQSQIH